MNVIMISPGFPDEMPLFTRALAEVGARVLGVGDQPAGGLPDVVRRSLNDYMQVSNLWDEEAVTRDVLAWVRGRTVERVECLWEPGMVLAARMREAMGVPGLNVTQSVAFRDKQRMKEVLDAAGIRTPHHYRARSAAECRAAAERIGFPIIIKPIAGAGSADTYPARDDAELEEAITRLRTVPEVSVEEYIEGEEYTFDTICARGEILFENVAWYRPKPLIARLNEWISAQAVCLADLERADIVVGRELGRRVIAALEFESGFTHMEWFRTAAGEAVFGEIAGRPPGGRLVHVMNYAADLDCFKMWAEAVCFGRTSQRVERRRNAAVIFKRAYGDGRIQRIEGLEGLLARFGDHIVAIDLVALGTARRDWRQVVSGDGWIVVRHADLETCIEIADMVGTDLRIYAG